MSRVKISKVSSDEADRFFTSDFVKKYRLSYKDELYIPSDWEEKTMPNNNFYDGKPIAFSKAALTIENIIRSIDKNMVSWQDYPVKPSLCVRGGGKPVFKWGIGRHMDEVPRESWVIVFAALYKLPYVALCIIRHNPGKDTYSAMVFFKDNAVFKD